MDEVFEIRKRFKSKNSLDMANVLLAKGKLHLISGELKEAKRCFSSVEKIYKRVHKQFRYIDMCFLFEAQSALEFRRGNYEACSKLISKAVSEFESTFVPLHPLSLGFLELQKSSLEKLGRVNEAKKVDIKIRKILKSTCINEASLEFILDEAA